MHYSELFEKVYHPQPWNPTGINPALMTFDEYYKLANSSNKFHPDSAYDSTEELKRQNKKDYPILLRRIKINGLTFEFRMNEETRAGKYTKYDDEGEIVKDSKGLAVSDDVSEDDLIKQRRQPRNFMIAIFNDDICCGRAQDEWGCVLLRVAKEYRGFGLGPILGKIARQYEPGKTSGGFTPQGYANFVKVYREMVRDALTNGLYSTLIKNGDLTIARVKEIVASANLKIREPKREANFSSNDPKDWLIYFEHDCCVIIYDKKLKDVDDPHFEDTMIKGNLLVRFPSYTEKYGLMVRFGGDTPKIKSFLLSCASALSKKEGVPLYIDEECLSFVDKSRNNIGPKDMTTGYWRYPVEWIGQDANLKLISYPEKAFRKSFDKYDEFKNRMIELADSKY